MNVTEFVDELFAAYTPNADLADFKAEVLANLRDRVQDLQDGGASPSEALLQAQSELGDIREIADQLSQQRARDVYAQAYLHHKVRPDKKHLLGYIPAAAFVVAGIALVLVGLLKPDGAPALVAGASVVFIALPVGTLVALGLTQETTTNLPMRTSRAIGFGAAVFLILAGLGVAGALLSDSLDHWGAALGVGLPLVVIGAGIATYLGVTQTNRKKPWVRQQEREWNQGLAPGGDPSEPDGRWPRFGLYLVALWTLALAVFLILGFTIGFQYSWITFLVASAGMFILMGWAYKGSED